MNVSPEGIATDVGTAAVPSKGMSVFRYAADRPRAWPDAFRGRLPIVDAAAPAREFDVRRGEGSTVAAVRPCPGWRSAVAQPD